MQLLEWLVSQSSSLEYVESLYNAYRTNPHNVEASWQALFAQVDKLATNNNPAEIKLALNNVINQIRQQGYLFANTNPLNPNSSNTPNNWQDFSQAQDNYCQTIALENNTLNEKEQSWWQEKMEGGSKELTASERKQILQELIEAEGLERYLGAKFAGAKRFSLEGSDSFIPLLKTIIRIANSKGVEDVVIGMAHRGRLNTLINVMGKKPQELCDEFRGIHNIEYGSGDVKYHQGFRTDLTTPHGKIHLNLAYNPSHLEIVSPVVQGMARAKQDRLPTSEAYKVLAITVHGDSAVIGQGIVQETLNLSKLRGFNTQGSIRIVINNQIGFTTSKQEETRSSINCTDVAKIIGAPVLHVNGDDPEAVVRAGELAVNYRQKFNRDIFINLISYRRHGHNEADEPFLTQPLMYAEIKSHPSVVKIYAEKLQHLGIIDTSYLSSKQSSYRQSLEQDLSVVTELTDPETASHWQDHLTHQWDEFRNNLSLKECGKLAEQISTLPEKFNAHSRVEKVYAQRKLMAQGKQPLDWGMGEMLAYASIIKSGKKLRLTGEDVERGTFSHRHAVLHDQQNGTEFSPLNLLSSEDKAVEIYNSPLSEAGVLAFEYGYSSTNPETLTIWEAQFGDFANGAQVVIDQFISAGEQKWGRMSGLTMLLPHGYEGQGPEHSSARLERYLQLCAENNMQVCIPTTPAQFFHLLREQIMRRIRRPLIVFTPKSLLRHPDAVSSLQEFTERSFKPVLNDSEVKDCSAILKVILCTGKIYYDLHRKRQAKNLRHIAIVRLEQLYPFPQLEVSRILEDYPNAKEFVWTQEEPQNQGAWWFIQQHLLKQIPASKRLQYVGRKAMASTATGYSNIHSQEQAKLVELALN